MLPLSRTNSAPPPSRPCWLTIPEQQPARGSRATRAIQGATLGRQMPVRRAEQGDGASLWDASSMCRECAGTRSATRVELHELARLATTDRAVAQCDRVASPRTGLTWPLFRVPEPGR